MLLTCQPIPLLVNHFLLFLELHSKELHCLVNYYKCFISVQRFENLHWSWFSALRICPFHSKILAAALFASYRWSSSLTLPNCIVNLEIASLTSLRTLFSFSQSSNYTLWLWLHTFCVTSITQRKNYTVIGTFAIILFAVIMVSSLQLQLAFLKPFWAFSH